MQRRCDLRKQPNVLLVHHQALRDDLPRQMRAIAAFLDITVPEPTWPDLEAACGFDRMRADARMLAPTAGRPAAKQFFHRGVNGTWREALPPGDHAVADEALNRLEPGLREWLTSAAAAARRATDVDEPAHSALRFEKADH